MLPVYVIYGTETFNAEDLAHRTGDALEEADVPVSVLDMADFNAELLPHLHTLLIVTSTFGDGDPPSNAFALHAALVGEAAPALPALRFSVCALGDTAYDHFCQCGKDFDARLGALGATRLVPRQDCDVDFEPPWQVWLDRVLGVLEGEDFEALGGADAATIEALEAAPAAPAAVGTRKNPFVATVVDNYNLNGPGASKETRHIALSLAGSGLHYKVGDSLGVFPRNCPDLVRRVLQGFDVDRDAPVEVDGDWISARDALIYRRDVVQIDPRLLALAAQGPQREALRALDVDRAKRQAFIERYHVVDLAQRARVRAEPAALVAALRPLNPRLYSISSSPRAHPDEVHLTVDVLRYDLHGTGRKGVASTFLAERAGPAVQVPIYLRSTRDFVLCDDDRHAIMCGPGTGVAPFRAFLEERAARGALGHNWLFFGARHGETDFLYREQLEGYVESGVLTRFDTAFSRDQGQKVYVQDRMEEAGDHLFAWLEAGAFFYICGDAARMAKDVHAALGRIVARHGRMSPEDASAYLAELSASGRYLKDVY